MTKKLTPVIEWSTDQNRNIEFVGFSLENVFIQELHNNIICLSFGWEIKNDNVFGGKYAYKAGSVYGGNTDTV